MTTDIQHSVVSKDGETAEHMDNNVKEKHYVAFKLYLDPDVIQDRNQLIETIESVCVGVYDSVDSFQVLLDSPAQMPDSDEPIRVRPTLLRLSPLPTRQYFGDLSNPERLHTLLAEDRRVRAC